MIQVGEKAKEATVCEGVPIPELAEKRNTHDGISIGTSSAALETNRNISSSRINESLAKHSTKACHGILVFIFAYLAQIPKMVIKLPFVQQGSFLVQ
jgi:hypothetical protein